MNVGGQSFRAAVSRGEDRKDLEFANGGLEEDEDVAKERKRRGSVFQVSTGRSEREKRRRETSRV